MKQFCTVLSSITLAAFLIAPQLGYAGARHSKMKTCNAEADAKGLSGGGKGGNRKAFHETCLSAKPAKTESGGSQKNKMKTCNKEAKAKSLAGDERKTFMKTCLSS